jgi:protein involved in polysaccharide export with SLBB domain
MNPTRNISIFAITAVTIIASTCTEVQASSKTKHRRSAHRASTKPVSQAAGTAQVARPAPAAPVMLIGEFKTPGPIAFTAGMTVKQAIAAAGGFTDNAETSTVKLSRAGKGWAGTLDGKKALDDDPFQNITLKPGDSLVADRTDTGRAAAKLEAESAVTKVAEPQPAHEEKPAVIEDKANAPEQKAPAVSAPAVDPGRIAIIGEVEQPGVFAYKPVMLKDALSGAGGLKKKADKGRIAIYRGGLNVKDYKKSRKVDYDLCKVEKGNAEDVALLPGDVVEVPVHRDRSVFGQISGVFNRMAGQVASLAGGVARPLLTAANPAAGFLLNAIAPAHRGQTLSGIAGTAEISTVGFDSNARRTPTQFETAMVKAIASESPEVRDRIIAQVKASLTSTN